jgi:hypothetical protein
MTSRCPECGAPWTVGCDDVGVSGVRLALAAIAGRGVVDGQAGEVGHRLVLGEQQPDEQGRAAVGGIHRPQHLALVGEHEHVPDQLQELGCPLTAKLVALVVLTCTDWVGWQTIRCGGLAS